MRIVAGRWFACAAKRQAGGGSVPCWDGIPDVVEIPVPGAGSVFRIGGPVSGRACVFGAGGVQGRWEALSWDDVTGLGRSRGPIRAEKRDFV